ncbi:MAG: hypothetical protein WDW38_008413 [Sanguina aurantia]
MSTNGRTSNSGSTQSSSDGIRSSDSNKKESCSASCPEMDVVELTSNSLDELLRLANGIRRPTVFDLSKRDLHSSTSGQHLLSASDVTFRNGTIHLAGGDSGSSLCVQGTGVEMEGVRVQGGRVGLKVQPGASLTLRNCSVERAFIGVWVGGTAGETHSRASTLVAEGLSVGENNGGSGLAVGCNGNVVLKNSDISGGKGYGISVSGGAFSRLRATDVSCCNNKGKGVVVHSCFFNPFNGGGGGCSGNWRTKTATGTLPSLPPLPSLAALTISQPAIAIASASQTAFAPASFSPTAATTLTLATSTAASTPTAPTASIAAPIPATALAGSASMNDLYAQWGSPHFYRSWAGSDPCSMVHIACDAHGHALLQITSLTSLRLGNNALHGPLPLQLTNLAKLVELDLSNNALTGQISQQLFAALTVAAGRRRLDSLPASSQPGSPLAALTTLDLSSNLLTGTLPRQLSLVSQLIVLNVSLNRLTGTLPEQLSVLYRLSVLALDSNQLTSSLPAQLSCLSALSVLSVGLNQLTGSLPSQVSCMTSLRVLDVSSNQLSRDLPAQISSLVKLSQLELSENRLVGPIPVQYSALSSLVVCMLGNNSLYGSLPAQLSSLSALSVMDVSRNRLSGAVPAEYQSRLGSCQFHCDGNALMCGAIPGSLNVTIAGTRLGSGNYSAAAAALDII